MVELCNPSQLVLRHRQLLCVPRLLLALPPADGLTLELSHALANSCLHVFTTQAEVSDLCGRYLAPQRVLYAHRPSVIAPPSLYSTIVVFLQKSRPFMEEMLLQLCPLLEEGGSIFVVGENRAGIKSWRKKLAAFGTVETVANACHGSLIRLSPVHQLWSRRPPSPPLTLTVQCADTAVSVASSVGVFGHGRLDRGTRLLLETLADEQVSCKVLDFGCGAGVIGCWLAARNRLCHPTLLDSDAVAVAMARQSLALNGLAGEVVASHGMAELKGRYQWVVSNPPFHEGVKTRYDVTEQFLLNSHRYLAPGGQLRIVANSFLRYRPLIEQAFGHCQALARQDGFTVYGASRR